MRPILLAALLVPVLLSPSCVHADHHAGWGWSGKRGSGVASTQQRDVGEFHAIRIESSCDVDVQVGGERSVAITTDDNLQEELVTEVRDGVLVIGGRSGSVSYRVGPRAEVRVPALDGLFIDGSGDVRIDGVSGAKFAVGVSGSGDMRIAGRTDRLEVSIAGSGDADLAGLEAREASISIQGSGDVRLRCSERLTASVSGSGDIDYIGSPQTSISIDGSGDVQQVR